MLSVSVCGFEALLNDWTDLNGVFLFESSSDCGGSFLDTYTYLMGIGSVVFKLFYYKFRLHGRL